MAVKAGIKEGVKIAPAALASLAVASGNPGLAPAALALGKPLSKEAGKALSKQVDRIPEKKAPKRRAPPATAPRRPVLPRAISMEAPAPPMAEPDYESPVISMEGQGLYAGRGMFGGAISYGSGYRNPKSFVAGKLSKENPALQSQPQFENSIMRRQMGRPVGIF